MIHRDISEKMPAQEMLDLETKHVSNGGSSPTEKGHGTGSCIGKGKAKIGTTRPRS